jgi:hypothetical protein
VGNTENFIVINGKKYDAVTGVMLQGPAGQSIQQPTVHKPVVDGFVRMQKDVSRARPTTVQHAAKNTVTPQRSKTLMRHVVKKPTEPLLKNTSHPTQKQVAKKVFTPKATVVPRTSTVPQHRQHLANTVQKSAQVKKFGTTVSEYTPVRPVVTPMQVHTAPPITATTYKQHSKTSDLLERALQAAEGHKEQFNEPRTRLHHKIAKKIGVNARTIVVSMTVLAGLVFGGLYAYQNVPKLAMRVAASRAGFNATLPDYNPSGFSFSGPVQYASGQVTVGYKSNTDERQYKLTQKTTDWTSESLLNNYIVSAEKSYQTYQDNGRTIYIYDENNATWVSGGIWYQIEGDSQLTTDQLVRIASSL